MSAELVLHGVAGRKYSRRATQWPTWRELILSTALRDCRIEPTFHLSARPTVVKKPTRVFVRRAQMSVALAGRRIAVPETRELDVFAQMLERHCANVVRCPLVAIR